MLHAGAEPAEHQQHSETREIRRTMQRGHGGGGQQRAEDEQESFTAPLAYGAGRKLAGRHRGGIERLEDADLGEAEGEILLPEWQQQVEHARIAVMEEMGEAWPWRASAGDRQQGDAGIVVLCIKLTGGPIEALDDG